MGTGLALNSARSLGEWLRQELAGQRDVGLMLRVVAHETGRWVANEQARAELPELIKQPACTGDRRWDALVEGVTAYRMNLAGLEPPQWTERTSLDEGWNPYDDSETPPPPQWALLDTFDTPAELLAKGVTYSRRNMALL